MNKKKYLYIKRYTQGIFLGVSIVGSLFFSTHYLAKEGKHSQINSQKLNEAPKNKHTIQMTNTPIIENQNETAPYANLNTGFKDSFQELSADEDVLHIHTKGKSSFSAGVSAQYKQEIFIDKEITAEFFSTPNFEKYIRGTVTRPSGLGSATKSIEKDVWGKKVSVFNSETMNYDREGQKIVYKTPNYTTSLSSVVIETNVFIDLGKWRKDTGRLVERESNYVIRSRTSSADWLTIGGKGSIVSVVIGEPILDSWIENPVEETTLQRLKEEPSYYYGNGLQDEVNEHPTNYFVELLVNGKVYKELTMKEDGSWGFDFDDQLTKTDIVSARVKGIEKNSNGNGVRNIKYSDEIVTVDETDIIPWEKWNVEAPKLIQAHEDELIIQGSTPSQNHQLNRSYKLSVALNGKEIYKKENLKDDTDILVPYIKGLVKGDKIEAMIVGSEEGKPDKTSRTTEMIVSSENKDDYDEWEVLAPVLQTDSLNEDSTKIKGQVPVQNRTAQRYYDLLLYVNDELVSIQSSIDVSLKPYPFEADVAALNVGDKVVAKVVGHQDDKESKSAETKAVIIDSTDYQSWQINAPTLNSVTDTDRVLTGEIGEQDLGYERAYTLVAAINGAQFCELEVEPSQEFTVELPTDIVLTENDEVSVTLIGKQPKRENKYSEEVVQLVEDGTHYNEWVVNEASVEEVYEHEHQIKGHISAQSTVYDRSYDILVKVNNEEVASNAVFSDSDYSVTLSDDIDLQENDLVTVEIIGHQNEKADKTSEPTELTVAKKISPTTSKFERGYWEDYGLVYEGLIGNEDWDLSDPSKIVKTVSLVEANSGKKIEHISAQNTDWYQAGRYNGYQFIIDNDTLGQLETGNYTIFMAVAIDGVTVDETELTLEQMVSRMGLIHEDYADLEQVVIKGNIVKPEVIKQRPSISIIKDIDTEVQLLNKYWNKQNQLVFEGYFQTDIDLSAAKKYLEIMDESGTVVYTKESLAAAPTSWGVSTGISDDISFQAIIPQEFTDQRNYFYQVSVEDQEGNKLLQSAIK
jgi:ketosteroid isomerase-like protein